MTDRSTTRAEGGAGGGGNTGGHHRRDAAARTDSAVASDMEDSPPPSLSHSARAKEKQTPPPSTPLPGGGRESTTEETEEIEAETGEGSVRGGGGESDVAVGVAVPAAVPAARTSAVPGDRGTAEGGGVVVGAAAADADAKDRDGDATVEIEEEEDDDDDDTFDDELRELMGDEMDDIALTGHNRDADLEHLLGDVGGGTAASSTGGGPGVDSVILARPAPAQRCCFGGCRRPYRIGNITVLFPSLFERTGVGSFGPHWWGTVCAAALLFSASYYYITMAYHIGPISGTICVVLTVQCTLGLMAVAFTDPGVITANRQRAEGGGGQYAGLPQDGRDLSDWRYCDLCSVYQPPKAAHCRDCGVCVDGYDHHCPWMGQCIGRKNMKAFVLFNLSWLSYLFYAIVWVSFGPAARKMVHHSDK